MVESSRIMLVTLLLCIFWLPSDAGSADEDDSTAKPVLPKLLEVAERALRQFDPPGNQNGPGDYDQNGPEDYGHHGNRDNGYYDPYGRWITFMRFTTTTTKAYDEPPPGYTRGEVFIDNLLKSFANAGCKAGTAGDLVGAIVSKNITDGERHIIKLLAFYFSSGCEESAAAAVRGNQYVAAAGLDFTIGVRQIVKLLISYFSTGCKDGGEIEADAAGADQDPRYSTITEKRIIKGLSHYLNDVCGGVQKSGEGPGGSKNTAGRHIQSVALELFLLVLGVCISRIEL